MTQPQHLDDEQMIRYRNRELTAVALLDLDEHLSACAECRDRLYLRNRSSAALKALRIDFSEHLQYPDIVACSEGLGKPLQLEHIRECSLCQSEVQDLSRFRTEVEDVARKPMILPVGRRQKHRIPLGIAAAVLMVAGGVTFALRNRPAGSVDAPPVQSADASIPMPERQILERAITSGSLERSPALDGLILKPGTPLGEDAKKDRIELLRPVGTAVLTDRPTLRWRPIAGASSYVVSVFDEKFQKVAESPSLETPEWQPPAPLPRGKVLGWQVTARTASGIVHAPAPPAREARFKVLPPEALDHIEKIRREHPGNPLLMAALFAHEGALDDAEAMLKAVDRAISQTYLESIDKIRRGD